MRENTRRSLIILICTLLLGTLAFLGLYRWDNKYTSALSGGWGYNVLQAEPEEPAFLVDGWEFYPGQLLGPEDFASGVSAEEYTYAGQHPNFSSALGSPYGQATYRIVLENPGEAVELALYLPELLCAGRVYIGGQLAGEQGSLEPYEPLVIDGVYTFTAEGDTEIIIQCANYTHYYSGMYYPPAVGTPGGIYRLLTARMLIYGLLCFAPLALALSNLALWLIGRDKLPRRAGLLCLFFALRLSYPFLRAMGVPPVRLLYAAEDLLGAGVLLCALLLAGELSGWAVRRFHRSVAVPAGAGLCAVTLVFPMLILPHVPTLINTYGVLIFIWKLLAGLYLVFLASKIGAESALGHGLLAATGLYGLSLVISVLTANYFEPVRGASPLCLALRR